MDEFNKTDETDLENNNQIIEVEKKVVNKEVEEINDIKPNMVVERKNENIFKKMKNFWDRLNTKGKVLFISLFIIIFVLIGVSIFFIIKKNKKEAVVEPPKETIVYEENYRYENGSLVFLNLNKEEIGRYTCENQNENACYVAYFSEEDNFDNEKRVYQNGDNVLIRSNIINDTFVFINDGNKIIVYNLKDSKVIGTYSLIKKVDNNKMILKNEANLYGLVEFNNNEMLTKLEFVYDYLGYLPNDANYIVSKQNNTSYILDINGRAVSKGIDGNIKGYTGNYLKIEDSSGLYKVVNYNNQNVFDKSYDYVEVYNDFVALVSDMSMYLKFYDNAKLNEDVIPLKNRDYVKTSIYDESKIKIGEKNSFTIQEEENNIVVTIEDNGNKNQVLINKSEGEFSKSLRYLNYFDGKLYVYSDNLKTSLLGTYSCANKNEVRSDTKELGNCKIATDTVFEDNDYEVPGTPGVIPVFNERFIFIEDGKDIVLYDLQKNSSLGKYKTVNTYSYTGTDDLTFVNTSNLQVVLKNNSNNFGVIRITSSDTVGHIGFNYSEMEKLRDCYVVKDANGYLLLDGKNGASKTSAIRYKIRNYNDQYIKVKREDNKYYIYKYDNEKSLNEKGYNYVELYDEYFAAVNENNKLGVYLYTDLDSNLIAGNELISLNSTTYYGSDDVAFKIANDKITIKGGSSTYDIIIPVKTEE